jgi:hypothetical protein
MKYTLIIGAGIHNHTLRKPEYSDSPLRSWDALMKKIGGKNYHNPLLGFESLITDTANKKAVPANQAESLLLHELAKILNEEQHKVLEDKDISYPVQIFNPEKVSDVIILNFDLVIEMLLSNGNLPELIKHEHSFYRIINGIKFWHPHGDIERPQSIDFGIREYGKNTLDVERLRALFKKDERSGAYDSSEITPTWYSAMILNPLVFAGTSLSFDEWGLWFALTSRKRNFATKGEELPIYTLNKKDAFCNLYRFTNTIAISDLEDYEKSWQSLIEFLN